MKIKVRYFASLREKVGQAEEVVETHATNAEDLFFQLNKKYQFNMELAHLKVSINRQYQDWQCSIRAEDEIVFIPPVAGG